MKCVINFMQLTVMQPYHYDILSIYYQYVILPLIATVSFIFTLTAALNSCRMLRYSSWTISAKNTKTASELYHILYTPPHLYTHTVSVDMVKSPTDKYNSQ